MVFIKVQLFCFVFTKYLKYNVVVEVIHSVLKKIYEELIANPVMNERLCKKMNT